MKLSPQKSAHLRALLAAATPGPWRVYQPRAFNPNLIVLEVKAREALVVHWAGFDSADQPRAEKTANAALIAAAVNALPALLDECERLERERDRLREALRGLAWLREGDVGCWCLDSTPPDGVHSALCCQARAALAAVDKAEVLDVTDAAGKVA